MLHLLAGIDKVQVQPPSCPLGWRVFGFLKHKQKETWILISEFFVVKTWSRKVSKSGKNDLIAFPRISQLNNKIQTFKASAETKKISTEIFSLFEWNILPFYFFYRDKIYLVNVLTSPPKINQPILGTKTLLVPGEVGATRLDI